MPARFCVSVSFVEKLRQRQRASGSVAALPHPTAAAPPRYSARWRAELGACLRQQPDAILDELRALVAALGRPAVRVSTMERALDW